MRKLKVFESVTLNGFFSGPNGDLGWAHAASAEPEFQEFVKSNASSPSVMLFGRITYDMMAGYWPSPMALQNDPVVAKGMNDAEKYVASRTMTSAAWANTTVINTDLVAAVRALKATAGHDLIVMGSGSIVTQLADAGLIDVYQIVVKSVALGSGRPLLEGVRTATQLRLVSARAIGAGSAVLEYEPVR